MDFVSTFKFETHRLIVIIVIPGVVALTPYHFLASSNENYSQYIEANPTISSLFAFLLIIAAGIILEEIGGHIEEKVFDFEHDKR